MGFLQEQEEKNEYTLKDVITLDNKFTEKIIWIRTLHKKKNPTLIVKRAHTDDDQTTDIISLLIWYEVIMLYGTEVCLVLGDCNSFSESFVTVFAVVFH